MLLSSPFDLSPHNTMALRCHALAAIDLTHEHDVVEVFNGAWFDSEQGAFWLDADSASSYPDTDMADFLAQLSQHPSALSWYNQDTHSKQYLPYVILSGGSNVILPHQLAALVLRPLMMGKQVIEANANTVLLEVMAGENWHDLVTDTVANGWYGLENLALIPGLVGAAPIQNIGAYGVQVQDCLHSIKAFHIPSQQWRWLDAEQCKFGYRDSRFKQETGDWLISRVRFCLQRTPHLVLDYGDLRQQAGEQPTPETVMQAVIRIRQSKLPDPNDIPNTGSFFKNPVISSHKFAMLIERYPDMVHYPLPDGQVKLAAGWLIDTAGLKGQGVNHIRTHPQQALVLTNISNGQATQDDIATCSQYIITQVQHHYGVTLEREPIWISDTGTLCS